MYKLVLLIYNGKCGFFALLLAGVYILAALVASCFLGALPPVDLRAVCLVRAMSKVQFQLSSVVVVALIFIQFWTRLSLYTQIPARPLFSSPLFYSPLLPSVVSDC